MDQPRASASSQINFYYPPYPAVIESDECSKLRCRELLKKPDTPSVRSAPFTPPSLLEDPKHSAGRIPRVEEDTGEGECQNQYSGLNFGVTHSLAPALSPRRGRLNSKDA
jgi:hypothetical protein